MIKKQQINNFILVRRLHVSVVAHGNIKKNIGETVNAVVKHRTNSGDIGTVQNKDFGNYVISRAVKKFSKLTANSSLKDNSIPSHYLKTYESWDLVRAVLKNSKQDSVVSISDIDNSISVFNYPDAVHRENILRFVDFWNYLLRKFSDKTLNDEEVIVFELMRHYKQTILTPGKHASVVKDDLIGAGKLTLADSFNVITNTLAFPDAYVPTSNIIYETKLIRVLGFSELFKAISNLDAYSKGCVGLSGQKAGDICVIRDNCTELVEVKTLIWKSAGLESAGKPRASIINKIQAAVAQIEKSKEFQVKLAKELKHSAVALENKGQVIEESISPAIMVDLNENILGSAFVLKAFKSGNESIVSSMTPLRQLNSTTFFGTYTLEDGRTIRCYIVVASEEQVNNHLQSDFDGEYLNDIVKDFSSNKKK